MKNRDARRALRRSGTQTVERIRRTAKAPVPARRLPPKIRRLMGVLTRFTSNGLSLESSSKARAASAIVDVSWMLWDLRPVRRDGRALQSSAGDDVRSHVPVCGSGKDHPCQAVRRRAVDAIQDPGQRIAHYRHAGNGIGARPVRLPWHQCAGAMEHRTRPRCPRSTRLPGTPDRGASPLRGEACSGIRCRGPVPVSLRVPERSAPSTSAPPNSRCREPTANRTSLGRTEPADPRIETSNGRATKPPAAGIGPEHRAEGESSPGRPP